MILAIDPGTFKSGWCLMKDDYTPVDFDHEDNFDLYSKLLFGSIVHTEGVIETMTSYGDSGQTVLDTNIWIGRFYERMNNPHPVMGPDTIPAKRVREHLCPGVKANDSTVMHSLVNRFSFDRHRERHGKGTKADPGFFYGFAKHVWRAYAVGVTYLDGRKA